MTNSFPGRNPGLDQGVWKQIQSWANELQRDIATLRQENQDLRELANHANNRQFEFNSALDQNLVFTASTFGIVLVSPDGHYWLTLVDNSGNLVTPGTDLGTDMAAATASTS